MKVNIFDRKKYIEALQQLNKRRAPDYIIEAYKEGYVKEINLYYKNKLDRKRVAESYNKPALLDFANTSGLKFLKEAASQSDLDFIKLFFKMTNLDIFSGNKLPPDAGSLIKQGIVKDFGLKDLFKKLR